MDVHATVGEPGVAAHGVRHEVERGNAQGKDRNGTRRSPHANLPSSCRTRIVPGRRIGVESASVRQFRRCEQPNTKYNAGLDDSLSWAGWSGGGTSVARWSA